MKSLESEIKLPTVGKMLVDPTDNPLTYDFGDTTISDEALDLILASAENFGGKRIFVVQSEALQEKFCAKGFYIPCETDRFFELKIPSTPSLEIPKELTFVSGDELKKYATEEAVSSLAQNSGFLPSKIAQNHAHGYAGFQLMCKYSQVFGIVKDNTLVGFCRLTDLGNNNYYLSDTWIDGKAISKEQGTALLYSRSVNTKNKRVFLIVPSDREEEFKRLGCAIPKDVVISFVPKGPAMDKLFQDELVKYGLKQSVRPSY